MNLGALLLDLKPLLADVENNLERIRVLLENSTDLAEFEVLRFYATPKVAPVIEGYLKHVDPRVKRKGLELVPLLFTRDAAAKVVRRCVKDPDAGVRARASAVISKLQPTDVALPDPNAPAGTNPRTREKAPPRWDSTGWFFGLNGLYRKRKAHPTELKDALAKVTRPKDRNALAKLLGLANSEELTKYMRAGDAAGSGYVSFQIPKARGGMRTITAPRAPLKKIQRTILRELLDPMPTHEACHGFVKKRSTVSNAEPHVGAKVLVKLDIEDFFPTVHFRRVEGLFKYYGYAPEVSRALAAITTWRPKLDDGTVVWPGVLPQGAPTSPALANLLCSRMDTRLTGLAKKAGAKYTRYADDLTFSFAEEPKDLGRFLWWVDQILQQEGFAQNLVKRRVLRPSNQQRVTGVVVNSGMFIPREERRKFRAILHNCREHGIESQARGRKDFRSYLLGFASYVKMVQPEYGAALLKEVRELLASEKAAAPAK